MVCGPVKLTRPKLESKHGVSAAEQADSDSNILRLDAVYALLRHDHTQTFESSTLETDASRPSENSGAHEQLFTVAPQYICLLGAAAFFAKHS